MEGWHDEPEGRLAKPEEAVSSREQRQVMIDCRDHRKDVAADQDVMQVRHDEMRVMGLPVEGHDGQHHACQAADDEGGEEPPDPEHRQFHPDASLPERADPREDHDGCRHGHQR